MLTVNVVLSEDYDEEKQEFVTRTVFPLQFEHSLVSLSKWESFYKRPFLSSDKTPEEIFWYVTEAMCITPDVPPEVFVKLTGSYVSQLNDYVSDSMTATTFPPNRGPQNHEIVTAELIYYWMFTLQIPIKCEHWHIERLLTLVRVFNAKNAPAKKMSKAEIAAQNRELNAQRRAANNSKG